MSTDVRSEELALSVMVAMKKVTREHDGLKTATVQQERVSSEPADGDRARSYGTVLPG
jgi:hypothetical protein